MRPTAESERGVGGVASEAGLVGVGARRGFAAGEGVGAVGVVVVVPIVVHVPGDPPLRRTIVWPERGVVPALRVPERVKGWLRAGVVLEAVMVRAVGVRVEGVADGAGLFDGGAGVGGCGGEGG